jgi:hypothetical protein
MDEPINSPVVSGDKTPEFGNSILDAFKRLEAKETATAPKAAQPQQDQPKVEPSKAPETPKEPAKKSLPDLTKKPEPAPEKAPENVDPEVPKTIKSTKAADDFKRIKEERDSLAKQIEELKKSPQAGDSDAKLKALQEERDSYAEKLRLLDIERHPEFVKKYETKLNSINDSIKALAGSDAAKLEALIRTPQSDYRDQQIDEIIESMTPAKRAKLGALLVQQDQVKQERDAEITEAKTDYEKIASQYKQQSEAKDRFALQKSEQVWTEVSKLASELEVFQAKEGDPNSAADVAASLDLARSIFNGENTEEDLAKAALWAAAAPRYREALYAQVEINKRLNAELSKLKGAGPSVASKGATAPAPTTVNPKSDDFIKSVMAKIR